MWVDIHWCNKLSKNANLCYVIILTLKPFHYVKVLAWNWKGTFYPEHFLRFFTISKVLNHFTKNVFRARNNQITISSAIFTFFNFLCFLFVFFPFASFCQAAMLFTKWWLQFSVLLFFCLLTIFCFLFIVNLIGVKEYQ